MAEAIAREIVLRKSYLPDGDMETIYFGGGTPSMLDEAELHLLLDTVHRHFRVAPGAEITLEANPDDLNAASLSMFARAGINRLSIGIQSFHEPHLRFMNRAHTALEAKQCVKIAQNAGIDNISIDLIYAIPSENHDILHANLAQAFALNVPHISAYCLTIEPQTAFGSWLKKKKIKPIEEEYAAQQFEMLVSSLAGEGYEQYEISNFARNGRYSRHNSSYWKQHPYLGVGPSAHSYNGTTREFNVSHNAKYLDALQKGIIPATVETLTGADNTNEYLLTGLRTIWGVDLQKLHELSNGAFAAQHRRQLDGMIRKGWVREDSGTLRLTEAGKLFADRISSDLFID